MYTPYSFIVADVPANLVAHYFVVVIQSKSIHIGILNLKHSHIAPFIHILANVIDALHQTAELNINMSIGCFAQHRRIWYHPTIVNVNVCVVDI
jgi:hypothetical protein